MNLKDRPHYDDGAAVAVPSPLLLPFYGNGTCSCSGGQVVKASSQVLPFCLRYIQYSYRWHSRLSFCKKCVNYIGLYHCILTAFQEKGKWPLR